METIIRATPDDIARNFKNLIRKRIVRDIPQNQYKLRLQKCYLVSDYINTITKLNSLFVLLPYQKSTLGGLVIKQLS